MSERQQTSEVLEMARTIKGTNREAIKRARKAEQQTRKIRQQISRANGR